MVIKIVVPCVDGALKHQVPDCLAQSSGRNDGQTIQATLIPRIRALAREAASSTLADLGACDFRADIAAMRRETQYSRLFRS